MQNRGFTLIEVMSALIIIGIVSAVAISRFGTSDAELTAGGEVVKSHLRYAQLRAMNSESVWGICCDGTDYWLFMNGDTSQSRVLPGEDADPVHLADKQISMGSFIISFDAWGRPYYNDAPAAGTTAGTTIVVSSSGTSSLSISVTPETGFIP